MIDTDSILASIKKLVGIADADTAFDTDIVMFINSIFMNLHQIGVGPTEGFMIEDDSSTWDEYIDINENPEMMLLLSSVKTYIYLKVKIVFDPPINTSVLETMKQSITELEWRLNIQTELK